MENLGEYEKSVRGGGTGLASGAISKIVYKGAVGADKSSIISYHFSSLGFQMIYLYYYPPPYSEQLQCFFQISTALVDYIDLFVIYFTSYRICSLLEMLVLLKRASERNKTPKWLLN